MFLFQSNCYCNEGGASYVTENDPCKRIDEVVIDGVFCSEGYSDDENRDTDFVQKVCADNI